MDERLRIELVGVIAGDLDVVTKKIVVADLERGNAGGFLLGALKLGNMLSAVVAQSP